MTKHLSEIVKLLAINYYKNNDLTQQEVANIFNVTFTVFKCVQISTIISLFGLHLIAAPSDFYIVHICSA